MGNGKEEAEEKEEQNNSLQLTIRDRLAIFFALLEGAFLPVIILLAILATIAVVLIILL